MKKTNPRSTMVKLNLGCGNSYHGDWVNIDQKSFHEGIIAHDLLKGIPYASASVDVVYHSHVLEHFPKDLAIEFLKECMRVLKTGGILRVVVPDLEGIIQNYLRFKNQAQNGDQISAENYHWTMLELYDQAIRSKSGGEMGPTMKTLNLPNRDFILSRMGGEATGNKVATPGEISRGKQDFNWRGRMLFLWQNFNLRNKVIQLILGKRDWENLQVGRFRSNGEIHMWMYDDYSLSDILTNLGFSDVFRCQATESQIPNWESFNLDAVEGKVRKPDSLFIEAVK